VVTANKKPMAGDFAAYQTLRKEALALGRLLKAEATVGAGLPIIDTLETMMGAGDRVTRAQGCLSGTLAYVLSQLEGGAALSQAVEQAVKLGYTEPDPMVDLAGADVARKAVILARTSRLVEGDAPVQLRGLVNASLVGLAPGAWRARVVELDAEMRAKVERAHASGKVLRFVASVSAGEIVVGPVEVDPDSPLGMLRGTDNTLVLHSERYDARPLVITGPGAGVDVTAMGVMGDILRIAAERR
jgi:homoserine dehydrogenase